MYKYLFLAMIAGTLLFACSNEGQLPDVTEPLKGIQFEIKATNRTEKGLRAGTPIYSQEATQHVTRVNIYAFAYNGTTFVYDTTYTVTGWTDGMVSTTYTVAEAEERPAGLYRFLAVGRDVTDDYILDILDETTSFDQFSANIAQNGDESEIFAGYAQAEVLDEGVRVSINMTRKVAGLLGYFKNVPQIINGETVAYLRLTVSATNLDVRLTEGYGDTPGAADYNIINIDLRGQTVVNGLYTGNTIDGVVKVENSQLSGAYLLPVSSATLTLALYSEGGTPLRSWLVREGTNTGHTIMANNFYTLGTKLRTDGTTGEDPDDPGDDDDPIDLLTDETIYITISPEWTAIHNLVIN